MSLEEALDDLLRLHAPALPRAAAPAQAAALGALAPPARAAALAALEAQHSAPRFFALRPYNFYSRAFDARAALYDGHVVPPVPCAVPLDNVHKASALLPPSAAAAAAAASASTGRLHGAEAEARDQRQGTLLDWAGAELPAEGPLGALRALREAGALVTVMLLPQGAQGAAAAAAAAAPQQARGRLRGIDSEFNTLLLESGSGALLLLPGARVLAVCPERRAPGAA